MNTSSDHNGPQSAYRAALDAGDIQPDPAQADAVTLLQTLHDQLADYQPAPKGGLRGLFRRKPAPAPRGGADESGSTPRP